MHSIFKMFAALTLAASAATFDAGAQPAAPRESPAPGEADEEAVIPPPAPGAGPVEAISEKRAAVVRVSVTAQHHDFFRPWMKKPPFTRRALGAVLESGQVLVTAELVANSTYIELEEPETSERSAAEVAVVDYDANLALLVPAEKKFLSPLPRLALADSAVGDRATVWQLESTGALLLTSALLTTIEVAKYPVDGAAFLTYRFTVALQYRDSSFSVPVVAGDKLTGILMRYDPRSQNADVIPAAVIRHFLADAKNPAYGGFPRAGLRFAAMRDPQLRRHTGVHGRHSGGVYVSGVEKDGPAAAAGLREGDVILSVAGKAIDPDGNYHHPQFGKIAFTHIVSTEHFDGDTVAVEFFRDGETRKAEVKVRRRPLEDYSIPPYTIDTEPQYYVLGGIVLQELSRQYLREWGNDWMRRAPERFVYYDRYQAELFEPGQKVVILSHVLPSPATIGYEQLSYLVVTKINGLAIRNLAQVPEALDKPVDGFHVIEFSEDPKKIFLAADEIPGANAVVQKTYGLPALSRLQEQPGPTTGR